MEQVNLFLINYELKRKNNIIKGIRKKKKYEQQLLKLYIIQIIKLNNYDLILDKFDKNYIELYRNMMRISRNKKQFQVSFDSNDETKNNLDKQQENLIQKFIKSQPRFQFRAIVNQEIQKFKKKVVGSANQYGVGNQKTNTIFLNFLEFTRQIGTTYLRNKLYFDACLYYEICLRFVDPEDEIFLQKFIVTKIDIINKFMFCIFEQKKEPLKYLDSILVFLQQFLIKAQKYAFQSNFVKSEVCLIELNYFYLARIFKKKKNYLKAIHAFHKSQQIISKKRQSNVYQKNQALKQFCKNLQIKIFYKISKCYRDQQKQQLIQQLLIYEGRALKEAQEHNPPLFQYISKKIRMYKSAKKFNEMMLKLEGKKKIQDEVLKHIEESSQKQISSLYDVYQDRPKNDNCCSDTNLKECAEIYE